MRRKDREILQKAQIAELIGRCQTVRMGMSGDDFPYIVPLSFGFEMRGERLIVYFHCAAEGKKLDLLARNNKVCLEWDILHGYAEIGNALMAEYESAIVRGRAREITDPQEKLAALWTLTRRYCPEHLGQFDQMAGASLKRTAVFRIAIQELTGKRKKYGKDGKELKFGAEE